MHDLTFILQKWKIHPILPLILHVAFKLHSFIEEQKSISITCIYVL